jgi:predicted ester cyclase
MSPDALSAFYRGYIDCLNRQDWDNLGRFVSVDAIHNGRALGLSGYRAMLEDDFRAIPDLRFDIALLVCEPPLIASRLHFDCRPSGELFDIPVNGQRVAFDENVFYEVQGGLISKVWSVIDKAAIARQI